MRIGIFGACREGVDCLRIIKGARLLDEDNFVFIDNDDRVVGNSLESCVIYKPEKLPELKLDLLIVAVIDVQKVENQVRNNSYAGKLIFFYGDQYFSTSERNVGMATIGRYSYYKPSTFLYNVKIGNFCHIGADCRLGLIGHDPNNLTTYPLKLKSIEHKFKWEGEPPKRLKPLIIEDDVYIGEGVSILAGITIGRGAVIGSKSLVTSSVEPYSVVGGIPARIISKRLNPEMHKKLETSGWVDMDIEAAIKSLNNMEQ